MKEDTYYSLDFGNYDFTNVKISRKIPICLVLDSSGSMRGGKIAELNSNIHKFLDYIINNPKARRICDLCIISFGDKVTVETVMIVLIISTLKIYKHMEVLL